jgi:AcrR family transcriptional regulator
MGRTRSFDIDEAVDRAMLVFWRRGYEATTLTELTGAMGIERPSLYAAFGNKESLFKRALQRYVDGPSAYVGEALTKSTSREVMEELLRGAADLQTDPETPPGCMMVQVGSTAGAVPPVVGQALTDSRLAGENLIRERFEQGARDGDLPPAIDAAALAMYVRTVNYGMAVQAASGATREDLETMIRVTMRIWSDADPRPRVAATVVLHR